jgi:HAD superfamily hydrolase (TIGR01509 family)
MVFRHPPPNPPTRGVVTRYRSFLPEAWRESAEFVSIQCQNRFAVERARYSPGSRLAADADLYRAVVRALIFDLDGTLVDTVYAHVFTWQQALAEAGMPIDGWRIHRRVGMSGGLFTRAVARELGRPISEEEALALQRRHAELFEQMMPERRPLPGAVELLRHLREAGIMHGVATSGARPQINASLEALGIGADTVVIERGDVARAKPEPDLFLACAERMRVSPQECYVIGDAVWDLLAARRANILGIGLLSGGYGEGELTSAGAYRVYRDPAELDASLDELGVLP